MKLGLLIAAEKVLGVIASKVELDGVRAFRLRKMLKSAMVEVQTFQEVRNDFILNHSEDRQLQIGRDDDAIAELGEIISKLADEEVEVSFEPILSPKDFKEVTVETLAMVEAIGLLKEGE